MMSSSDVKSDYDAQTTASIPDESVPPQCHRCGQLEIAMDFDKLRDEHIYCSKCIIELANKGLYVK